jgi:hypothetical protein
MHSPVPVVPAPPALAAGCAPAFIDVEASGLGTRSYPIEVGLIKGDGSIFCTLILPPEDWSRQDERVWDPGAEQVHGITRPILKAHGKPLEEVARELNRVAGGLTLFSDAWGNDYPWLAKLFDAADLPMLFHIESSRKLLTDDEAARWQQAKEEVIAELNLRRHRASSDAKILQMTLLRVKGRASAPAREAGPPLASGQ